MKEIQLDDLPQGAVAVNGNVASFEIPNPDNPDRPIRGTATVEGGRLQLFTDRSSIQRRFCAHYGF